MSAAPGPRRSSSARARGGLCSDSGRLGVQEDALVLQLVKQYGTKKWSHVGNHLKGRTGKQCRERCV